VHCLLDANSRPFPALTAFIKSLQIKWDVFLCHPGCLKPYAKLVYEELQQLGFSAFLDEYSLSPGDDICAKIKDSATQAAVKVAFFNLDFFQRQWPMAELELIKDADTLLPVLVDTPFDNFKAAVRDPFLASQLLESDQEKLLNTACLRVSGAENSNLRDMVCFSVLQIYIEKFCPRLPPPRVGAAYIGKALKAVEAIQRNQFLLDLTVRRRQPVAGWILELQGMLPASDRS
jgi:hypothetical protein